MEPSCSLPNKKIHKNKIACQTTSAKYLEIINCIVRGDLMEDTPQEAMGPYGIHF
jgi:hypothetical protein